MAIRCNDIRYIKEFGHFHYHFIDNDLILIIRWLHFKIEINSSKYTDAPSYKAIQSFFIFGKNSFFGAIGSLFSNSGLFSGGLVSGGNTTNSTTTMTNHFNIYGNDSNSIGDEIANRLGKMYPTRLPY